MEPLRSLLPSVNSLLVFEAAGRHLSFTRAGQELGMSQAAVSFAVRKMEDELGVPLFTRRHRSVALTEAGARFHADVAVGLTHIRKSAEELRALSTERHVTLSASGAFASYWMLPRLPRLREDLPEVDLRIQTSDRDIDILQEGVPLALRCGRSGDWPGCHDIVLTDETVDAVVSPAYVEQNGMPRTVAEIARHRLIHLEEPFRPATDWEDWFRSAGVATLAIQGTADQRLRPGGAGGPGRPGHRAWLAAPDRADDRAGLSAAGDRPRLSQPAVLSSGLAGRPGDQRGGDPDPGLDADR